MKRLKGGIESYFSFRITIGVTNNHPGGYWGDRRDNSFSGL